ncbi:hypothetical protein [Microbacterium candidum]|uniref:AAA+ ATPase domain-containing protein n=1 Tax=Microbacterium candidum TaxID=3041922 RepID=A0ABT7MUY2_9MICO|nr:hypothetical protein [Microbacterium sp. ASV49]MDL9978266.1 hypothetical protein [Microbacterium sp. ASV49]
MIGESEASATGTTIVRATDVDHAAQYLATALTLEGIRGLRGRALLLHAAAIAFDDGRVIGFVGPSGRGKTTASRALAQAAGYVTDETLAVLPDLSVIPYPKPLSVLSGPPPKRSIDPAGLGMQSLPDSPLRLGALALLERRPDIVEAYVENVELSEAIGLIVPETSSLIAMPRPLGDLVDVIQRTGGVRRVIYSEAGQLPALLPELLALATPPREDVEVVTPVAAESPRQDGIYRRAPFHDAVRIGQRLAIHDGERVVILDGLGPELWESADGASRADLVARVTRLDPPPEGVDAGAEVERRLIALAEAGLLIRD